jgi:hypothetical protein
MGPARAQLSVAVRSARICSTRFLLGAIGGRCIGTIGMVYPGTLFHRRQRDIPMHFNENRSQIRALAVRGCPHVSERTQGMGTHPRPGGQKLGPPPLESDAKEPAKEPAGGVPNRNPHQVARRAHAVHCRESPSSNGRTWDAGLLRRAARGLRPAAAGRRRVHVTRTQYRGRRPYCLRP